MSLKSKLLYLFILCGFFSVAQQNDSLLKMFRSVQVQKGRKIILQSNIEKLVDIAVRGDKDNYSLKKGSYSVADSIGIETDRDKKIISISFLYDYDTAYVHELHKYQKVMGYDGNEYQFMSKEISVKSTKWQDKKTIFELVEVIAGKKKTVYAVIFDKELYYKKVSQKIDLNKTDNSIELLKRLGVI